MRKIGLRLSAVLLTVCCLVGGLASCGQKEEDNIPEGMQIACCFGADYRLFVPTSWNLNTGYGISGAYHNLANQSTVSVNRYEPTGEQSASMTGLEGGDRLDWYWENVCYAPVCEKAFSGSIKFSDDHKTATVLGGCNARKYLYSGIWNGNGLVILQVLCERNGAFYLFSYTGTEAYYDLDKETVGKMLEVFRFEEEPYEPLDYALKLAECEAPAGMQTAFGEDVAYRFFVPSDWTVDLDREIYAATYTDGSSFSVSPYLPSDSMSVEEYFAKSESLMNTYFGGKYTFLSKEASTLGGRDATVYEYQLTVNGIELHYKQYIAVYKSMIYALTYTAKEENFASHLTEFAQVRDAFSFR